MSSLLLALLLALMPLSTFGAAAGDDESGDPGAVSHSADGNYLDFTPFGKPELPRLFLVRGADGSLGFDAFATTHGALDAGYRIVNPDAEAGGFIEGTARAELIESHDYIYYTIAPAAGEVVIDFSITRQLLFVFIVGLIITIVFMRLAGKYKAGIGRTQAPKGRWMNALEVLIIFIRDEVAAPSIGPKYKKFLPYLLTVFFFILLGNLIGLIPFSVTPTSHIMVTGALAFFTFLITQLAGTRDYWMHILWPPNVPVAIKLILIPIEIVGIFTKPLALAFRLFGNMVSGHLVIVSILGLIFIFAAQVAAWFGVVGIFISVPLTLFIYLLKLVVSFIQAYIFTMLSAVFIGIAAEEHDHHHEHDHAHDAAHHGAPALAH